MVKLGLDPYFCNMQQKIVITGGPGTGKTTVINELIRRNYTCMPEISRQVILNAREKGIEQLFLTEPLLFSQMLLDGRVEQFKQAVNSNNELIFFDRGIPDVHSYMDFLGTTYPELYIAKSNKLRYSSVFLMPPWENIYTSDNERYETYDQSLKIYQHIKKGYHSLGYTIIEVPIGTVKQRTDYIINSL